MCNLCEETDDEDDELHLTVIPHHTHEPGRKAAWWQAFVGREGSMSRLGSCIRP
jgi:hypothetical protein